MTAEIAPATADEAPALRALWDRALGGRFPLSARLWAQAVADDPNARPGDGLVLRLGDGMLAGFALTRRFRQLDAYPALAPVGDLGWIMALVVAPEYAGRGYGARLLAAAEGHLRAGGAARCDLGGSLGHLLPGPPADDERALRFWRAHGYRPARLVHDLHRALADWEPPPAPPAIVRDGWRVAPGVPGEEGACLAFLAAHFPGRWHHHLAETLARGGRIGDVILLRAPGGAVAGFAATWPPDGPLLGPATHWFPALGARPGGVGPLGIAPAARGLGLGLALVAAAVSHLRDGGATDCAIDWTDLGDFYARLGFRAWRGYWRCGAKGL